MTDATADTRDEGQTAGDQRLRWLRILRQPALMGGAGGLLAMDELLVVHAWVRHVQDALSATLDRRVELRVSSGPACNAATESGFSITIEGSSCGHLARIELDAAAARAIVSPLMADHAELRGDGPLTASEYALLEYAALCCADRVARVLPKRSSGFRFAEFCRSNEGSFVADPVTRPAFDVTLAVSGATGRMAVRLTQPWPAGLCDHDALAVEPVESDRAFQTDVHFALQPITIAHDEWAAGEPGDVLLVGCTSLNGAAGSLVTREGWRISSALPTYDAAGLLSVRCGEFAPAVRDGLRDDANRLAIVPQVGARPVCGDEILEWRAGRVIDLPVDQAAPVRLFVGLRCAADGDWVRVDQEVGVRIVRVYDHAA